MGTRFIKQKRCSNDFSYFRSSDKNEYKYYRLVYWDDGSVWSESENENQPRAAEEGELWIAEAVQQFRRLLAGKSTEFAINFTDGNAFVGKLKKVNRNALSAEGGYYLVVQVKGEKKPRKGWLNAFKPTPEKPDIIAYVTQNYAKEGKEIESIEIKEHQTKKGGKKWAGVFFSPPK